MRLPALFAGLTAAVLALPACTSTPDVLEPSALVSDSTRPQPSGFPLAAPPAPAGQPQAQAIAPATDARIRFAPMVGAPEQASTPLASQLASSAGARGITLVDAGAADALVMKGYFSAIADPGETTVIYVWDVMDAGGNRVHRIQGQAKSPGGSADGWSSVRPATMEAIADQTVEQLAAWLVSRQG